MRPGVENDSKTADGRGRWPALDRVASDESWRFIRTPGCSGRRSVLLPETFRKEREAERRTPPRALQVELARAHRREARGERWGVRERRRGTRPQVVDEAQERQTAQQPGELAERPEACARVVVHRRAVVAQDVHRVHVVVAHDPASIGVEYGGDRVEDRGKRSGPRGEAGPVSGGLPGRMRVRERVAFVDARWIERVQQAQAVDDRGEEGSTLRRIRKRRGHRYTWHAHRDDGARPLVYVQHGRRDAGLGRASEHAKLLGKGGRGGLVSLDTQDERPPGRRHGIDAGARESDRDRFDVLDDTDAIFGKKEQQSGPILERRGHHALLVASRRGVTRRRTSTFDAVNLALRAGIFQDIPLGDAATCTCAADPVCSTTSNTCASTSTLATCAKDAQGCFFESGTSACSNGACSGGACCTNACSSGQTECVGGQIATCALGGNGCYAYGTAAACPGANQTCAGAAGSATCTCTATTRSCSGTCKANDVNACGPSCTVCTAPTGGSVSCNGTSCFPTCTTSGQTNCSGSCVDTTSDPNNCGACGSPCSGTCAHSRCTITLASNQGTLRGIAVDADNVYWTNNGPSGVGGLLKLPIGGTQVISLTPTNGFSPYSVAIDSTNVYWTDTNAGNLYQVPITGGTPTLLATGFPSALVVGNGKLYYGLGGTSTAGIYALTLPFTAGETATTLSSTGTPYSMVVDTKNIYWADFRNGNINITPLTGGLSTFISMLNSPSGLALDSSAGILFYAVDQQPGEIYSVATAGGSAMVLPTTQPPGTFALAIDATTIYFTGSGSVYEMPRGGGGFVDIADGEDPLNLAIDSKYVYWTDYFAGTVMRTPK